MLRRPRQPVLRPLFFLLPVFLVFFTGIDTWQARPRPPLPSINDGAHRYAGAVHVHSTYSDGGGTVDDIMQAAREADLDFLVLTDHSSVQAALNGEQGYRNDVLFMVGEEVNTSAGHLLALGAGRHVEQAGPEGLQALLDTIHAAEGVSILAHPDGRRPWTDWSLDRIHGLEIFNADSEWRNDNPLELLQSLFWYIPFPDAALNNLIDRPDSTLARWDTLAQRQPVVGVGSVDAHARIPLWGERSLRFPPYARMFRLLRTYVVTDERLTGAAGTDEALIMEAVRTGRCYIAVDGFERAGHFSFEIRQGDETIRMGAEGMYRAGSMIHVTAGSSGAISIRVIRNGALIAEAQAQALNFPITTPGVYRVEVYQLRPGWLFLSETPRPWIFSNPIWLRE